jgi:hypothetical protein
MPTLEAVTEFWYDEKIRKIGEQFEASDEDARLLSGWNKAKKVGGYKTAQVKPVEDDAPSKIEDDTPKKRKYMRRDMRAQE